MVTNPYQQYQSNSVMTANPAELTLMLYNGAIKFCNKAIDAIEKKDIPKGHEYIVRAQEIIIELQESLDFKYAIANEFNEMYNVIRELLVEANINKDIEKIEQAMYFIREFIDVWKQIMKQAK